MIDQVSQKEVVTARRLGKAVMDQMADGVSLATTASCPEAQMTGQEVGDVTTDLDTKNPNAMSARLTEPSRQVKLAPMS